MKVISYSLWGTNPTYTVGAIRNAEIAKELFPDWKCIFYCFSTVPSDIIEKLKSFSNVEIRMVSNEGDNRGMFNRFLPSMDSDTEYFICRDTDSRLSLREKYAIEEWINSQKDFHIMRDHPYHGTAIMGGMWGIKGNKLNGLYEAIQSFNPTSAKGQDQQFLTSWIYPKIQSGKLSCIVHDPFFEKNPFPDICKRGNENNGVYFVGQVFDEHDKYNSESDIEILLKHERYNQSIFNQL